MTIKSGAEIANMQQAGKILFSALELVKGMIKPGVTTSQIDKAVETYIYAHGATPSFKNYRGFPASVCVSVNEMVVHGIPSGRKIQDGDIVSVDIGVCYNGYHADAARTYPIGNVKPELLRLIEVTEKCFFAGAGQARAGKRIGDIGAAVQTLAEGAGYSVVRDLVGHGIGQAMHEPPDVPNFGRQGHGIRLERNQTIAIEPMINLGKSDVLQLEDGWGIVAADGLPSAHYENTIAITDGEPMILTLY